tara:strand:+ start:213 stop:416 length:204 start_codon:yes stop_codon:yes gene_type:complete
MEKERYKYKIEYIEERIKEIDKDIDIEDKHYYVKTSTIYRVLIDDLIELYNNYKNKTNEKRNTNKLL